VFLFSFDYCLVTAQDPYWSSSSPEKSTNNLPPTGTIRKQQLRSAKTLRRHSRCWKSYGLWEHYKFPTICEMVGEKYDGAGGEGKGVWSRERGWRRRWECGGPGAYCRKLWYVDCEYGICLVNTGWPLRSMVVGDADGGKHTQTLDPCQTFAIVLFSTTTRKDEKDCLCITWWNCECLRFLISRTLVYVE